MLRSSGTRRRINASSALFLFFNGLEVREEDIFLNLWHASENKVSVFSCSKFTQYNKNAEDLDVLVNAGLYECNLNFLFHLVLSVHKFRDQIAMAIKFVRWRWIIVGTPYGTCF